MQMRELSAQDKREIKALIRTAFAAEPWNDRWNDDEVFDRYLADLMDNENSVALGMFDGEELVGISIGRVKHWFNGVEYSIDDLCVKPGRQGGGLGSEMIRLVRAYSDGHGFAKISLKTSRKAPAYHFYQKNGFEEMAEDVWFELKV